MWYVGLRPDGCKPQAKSRVVRSAAVKLYQKRKTEILEGKKLPEQLRGRVVRFAEIADDALAYCKANNQGQQFDAYRIRRLKDEFGDYPGRNRTLLANYRNDHVPQVRWFYRTTHFCQSRRIS